MKSLNYAKSIEPMDENDGAELCELTGLYSMF